MAYHQPFTTKAELEDGLHALKGRHGAAKALQALRYVCDKSASPREAESCLALVLPSRLGGANLSLPLCNERIELTDASSGRSQCFFGDLVWPDQKLIIEYNGKKYHTDAELDQHRRDLLEHAGWNIRVISKRHTNDDVAFFEKLKQISGAAGKRFRAKPEEASKLRKRLYSGAGQLRKEMSYTQEESYESAPYPDSWE